MASDDAPPPPEIESMSGGTYYQILGVAPNASSEDIKNSYRKLARKLHPDKNRDDPNATARMQELQEAFEVLSDPEQRAAYDQQSDFILRAFAEGSTGDDGQESFLAVPSSRAFWCLLVEACLADNGQMVTALAGQLEDETWDELSKGGVCGFTLLHFAAFAGRSKACQALIDLGVNVNAKTQPLFVTTSQQLCRPTPLDLTVFIQNKRAREMTQRALQLADGSWGGVKMENLEQLWLGLIKHQMMLIKDEVLKFTKKIPAGLRRVLSKEPRWREMVNFPGEDAASMERKRLRKNFALGRKKFVWVMIGDSTMELKERLMVLAWNFFLFLACWWLFGFNSFELLQAILVSVVLMMLTSLGRGMQSQDVWKRLPSQEDVRQYLPPEKEVEQRLQRGWGRLCASMDGVQDCLAQAPGEFRKLKADGLAAYAEDAKARFLAWQSARAEEAAKASAELEEEEDTSPAENAKKKKAANIANKIREFKAERESSGAGTARATEAPRGVKGRRRK
eukprot:TRINITY_DN75832_c0_g1_i1.p1 TRINITY_DN75832_c0_g1~~TRINITY_DN75832_c0_g1_i1.p1  ORF type:complete len:508 (+),score=131.82 TRINITY_DN75832_c0_g1_i1:68-1591(+)